MKNRSADWIRQAQNDLLWAKDSLESGFFAQTCYISQQIAEKSLKAYGLYKGYDQVRSHSVTQICKALDINGDMERMGKELDLYYISARYPDAFPEGAPFEYFSRDQAIKAFEYAETILTTLLGKMDLSDE